MRHMFQQSEKSLVFGVVEESFYGGRGNGDFEKNFIYGIQASGVLFSMLFRMQNRKHLKNWMRCIMFFRFCILENIENDNHLLGS